MATDDYDEDDGENAEKYDDDEEEDEEEHEEDGEANDEDDGGDAVDCEGDDEEGDDDGNDDYFFTKRVLAVAVATRGRAGRAALTLGRQAEEHRVVGQCARFGESSLSQCVVGEAARRSFGERRLKSIAWAARRHRRRGSVYL